MKEVNDDIRGWSRYALLVLLLILCVAIACGMIYVALAIVHLPVMRPLGTVALIQECICAIIAGYAAWDEWRYLKEKKEEPKDERK